MAQLNASGKRFDRRNPTRKHRINNFITAYNVLVIDETGTKLGVLPTGEAIALAASKELDLVEINAASSPPVCKILNYGKFLFEETKKEKALRRNQSVVEIKEVQLRPNIALNDLKVKTNYVCGWFKDGHKVKIVIRFSKREMERADLISKELVANFLSLVGPHKISEPISKNDRKCSLVIERA